MRGEEKEERGGGGEGRARVGGGERVVSVVRHERKLERGSPLWRPGNRKRPNARHEAAARPKKSSSQQPGRKRIYNVKKAGAPCTFTERKSNLEQRSRRETRKEEEEEEGKKKKKKKKGFYDQAASVERAADQRALYIN